MSAVKLQMGQDALKTSSTSGRVRKVPTIGINEPPNLSLPCRLVRAAVRTGEINWASNQGFGENFRGAMVSQSGFPPVRPCPVAMRLTHPAWRRLL